MRYNVSSIILHPQQWHMCTKLCKLLKVFNDATNTLSGIYYLIINLLIIKNFNIVDAFDDCMTQEPGLVSCILVMKFK